MLITFRSILKTFCQSLGFASLVLLPNYCDLLTGGSSPRMHAPISLAGICLAQIADILLLTLAMCALLIPLRRTQFYPLVQLMLAVLAPPFIVWRAKPLLPFELSHSAELVMAVLWASFMLLMLTGRSSPRYAKVMNIGSGLGASFAIFGILSIVQLAWVTQWKPGPQEHLAAWANTPQPPRQHALMVWIVFDELSYDQTFEHRARDLDLPNFDALRSQSILFTDVQPAGYKTVKVIPSLLSGEPVEDLRYDFQNRLTIHTTGQHGFHPLAGSGTVFADAKRAGWRTAAVGWFNPYCSLYAGAIDECYWSNWDKLEGPMAQHEQLWSNTIAPMRQIMLKTTTPVRADRELCTYDVRQRYETHIDLEQHTMQLLRTDQADFVFLHLPIPHSPNIWSRMHGSYTQNCDSSYLDGLALADRELGQITQILKSSSRWKDTTLIVEGDHGWRIGIWADSPAWTPEDDAASHRVFDPRPVVMIHQPGQVEPQTNATSWPLLRIHSVVDEVLRGQTVQY